MRHERLSHDFGWRTLFPSLGGIQFCCRVQCIDSESYELVCSSHRSRQIDFHSHRRVIRQFPCLGEELDKIRGMIPSPCLSFRPIFPVCRVFFAQAVDILEDLFIQNLIKGFLSAHLDTSKVNSLLFDKRQVNPFAQV